MENTEPKNNGLAWIIFERYIPVVKGNKRDEIEIGMVLKTLKLNLPKLTSNPAKNIRYVSPNDERNLIIGSSVGTRLRNDLPSIIPAINSATTTGKPVFLEKKGINDIMANITINVRVRGSILFTSTMK